MGFVIKDWMLVAGGLGVLALLTFQVLQGLRRSSSRDRCT